MSRQELINEYHMAAQERRNIVNPNACGIRQDKLNSPEVIAIDSRIDAILAALSQPEYKVQPLCDGWQRQHGFWLNVAFPDAGLRRHSRALGLQVP